MRGSNDIDAHRHLYNEGIDVVVLDHHEADIPDDYKYAIVINNNNKRDLYPNKNFSGVGITWQFCRYIDSILNLHNADEFIDLVALGL